MQQPPHAWIHGSCAEVSYPLRIIGLGRYLPERVVPSSDLEQMCRVPPGWVEHRNGVRERRWVDPSLTIEDERERRVEAEEMREMVEAIDRPAATEAALAEAVKQMARAVELVCGGAHEA